MSCGCKNYILNVEEGAIGVEIDKNTERIEETNKRIDEETKFKTGETLNDVSIEGTNSSTLASKDLVDENTYNIGVNAFEIQELKGSLSQKEILQIKAEPLIDIDHTEKRVTGFVKFINTDDTNEIFEFENDAIKIYYEGIYEVTHEFVVEVSEHNTNSTVEIIVKQGNQALDYLRLHVEKTGVYTQNITRTYQMPKEALNIPIEFYVTNSNENTVARLIDYSITCSYQKSVKQDTSNVSLSTSYEGYGTLLNQSELNEYNRNSFENMSDEIATLTALNNALRDEVLKLKGDTLWEGDATADGIVVPVNGVDYEYFKITFRVYRTYYTIDYNTTDEVATRDNGWHVRHLRNPGESLDLFRGIYILKKSNGDLWFDKSYYKFGINNIPSYAGDFKLIKVVGFKK